MCLGRFCSFCSFRAAENKILWTREVPQLVSDQLLFCCAELVKLLFLLQSLNLIWQNKISGALQTDRYPFETTFLSDFCLIAFSGLLFFFSLSHLLVSLCLSFRLHWSSALPSWFTEGHWVHKAQRDLWCYLAASATEKSSLGFSEGRILQRGASSNLPSQIIQRWGAWKKKKKSNLSDELWCFSFRLPTVIRPRCFQVTTYLAPPTFHCRLIWHDCRQLWVSAEFRLWSLLT